MTLESFDMFKILAIFSRCQSSIEVYRCFARYSLVDLVSPGRRRKEKKLVPNFHDRPVVKPRSHGYISVELSTLKKRSLVTFVIFIAKEHMSLSESGTIIISCSFPFWLDYKLII